MADHVGREATLNIGLLLFIPYRAMESAVFADLRDSGFDDLTTAQARVFQRIGPDGTRLTDLAEQAQVTKQTAGFLVDQLEQHGYVHRTPDPTDARARLVRISVRGEQAARIAAIAVERVEAQWARHLGKPAMRQLRQSLNELRDITDPFA